MSSVWVLRHDDKVFVEVNIGADAIHAETYDDGVVFVLHEDEAQRIADVLTAAAADIRSATFKDSALPVEAVEFQS